jgi:hypothetical protein
MCVPGDKSPSRQRLAGGGNELRLSHRNPAATEAASEPVAHRILSELSDFSKN